MEVYVENTITWKGMWIKLPQSSECLHQILSENELIDEGEYQLSTIRDFMLPEQQCMRNLFTLNNKIKGYMGLSTKEKYEMQQIAFDNVILFEEVLYFFF